MSTALIPYHPREGRQYLRSETAVVVHNPDSQKLEPRALPPSCPTCNRPWPERDPSPERHGHHFDRPYDYQRPPYVDPNYFRMLRPLPPAEGGGDDHALNPPGSPVRRLAAEPVRDAAADLRATYVEIEDEEEPSWARRRGRSRGVEGSKIRKESFSQGYFDSFFVEEAVLGKGGKGVVLLVRHELNDNSVGRFACKRVPVGDDHAWLEKVLVEVRLLAFLDHPNLVSYHHVWLETKQLTRFGPEVVCAFILQQYCNGGDLHTYVLGEAPKETTKEALKAQMRRRSKGQAEMPSSVGQAGRQLEPAEIYSLFKDITSGVASLHAENYVHRDLKPSNCLLHRDRHGKLSCLISDFGEVQPLDAMRNNTGSTGTLSYCAPEVLQADSSGQYGNFTFKSDVFSMGMILYFMCFGRLPYRSANAIQEELEDIDELRAEISQWQGFQEEKRMRPDLPKELYKLLKQLLAVNPAQRPSADDVLKALTNEANFDAFGMGKGARGSTAATAAAGIGLRTRVQNLDSPARGGTPVPEPTKSRGRHLSTNERPATWPKETSPPGNGIGDLRHRSTAMALSRSRDSPGVNGFLDPAGSAINTPTDSLSHMSEDRHPHLLLPPPPTFLGRLSIFNLSVQSPTLLFAIRVALFSFKLATLVQPCQPYLPNPNLAVPLVVLAAVDLGNHDGRRREYDRQYGVGGEPRGLGLSFALLAIHLVVVVVARRWTGVCIAAQQDFW